MENISFLGVPKLKHIRVKCIETRYEHRDCLGPLEMGYAGYLLTRPKYKQMGGNTSSIKISYGPPNISLSFIILRKESQSDIGYDL